MKYKCKESIWLLTHICGTDIIFMLGKTQIKIWFFTRLFVPLQAMNEKEI